MDFAVLTKIKFKSITWASWGELFYICCKNPANALGSFLINCFICANWGEFIIPANKVGSKFPVCKDCGCCPTFWGGWTGWFFGIPFNRYSTALSGLLNAAFNAFTTCYLSNPIFINYKTVASYCYPTTKLFIWLFWDCTGGLVGWFTGGRFTGWLTGWLTGLVIYTGLGTYFGFYSTFGCSTTGCFCCSGFFINYIYTFRVTMTTIKSPYFIPKV